MIKYLINKSIEGFSKGQFKKTLKKIILTLIKKNTKKIDIHFFENPISGLIIIQKI